MANPIFDRIQKTQVSNNPISVILGKMKEFKQGFDRKANPMELAGNYLKNNKINGQQANQIVQLARQAVDAGIASEDDYKKFAQMLGCK